MGSPILAMILASMLLSPAAPGVWPLPDAPEVVRPFDPPAQRWLAGHRGVDLRTKPGATVLAPLSGVVVFAAVVVDRSVVVISDGPRRVSLEPVRSMLPVGTPVIAGQPIGTVTTERSHCSPACLHWGLRVRGVYHDPLLLVLRYRAALIPCRPELCGP